MLKVIAVLLVAACSFVANAQTGVLVLKVKGVVVSKGGQLSAGIFLEKNFPTVGMQLLGQEIKVSSDTHTITFNNVPQGTYGVAVFQDIDSDKKLNTNLVGFPTEPIGFSNDARIRLGPPSFSSAAFNIEGNKTTVLEITLR